MLNFTEPICYNRENAPLAHRRGMERTFKADSGLKPKRTGSDRHMILLLVIGMILVLILGTSGVLSPWFSLLVLAAGTWALIPQVRQIRIESARLRARQSVMKAEQCLAVRHLGGLNLPVESPVNLFIWRERIRLESDIFSLDLAREQNPFLILLTRENRSRVLEQIAPPPDDPAGLRLLSELKERIRCNDRSIRTNRIVMLLYRDNRGKPSAAAFLTRIGQQRIRRILNSVDSQDQSGGTTEEIVLKKEPHQ